MRSTSFRDDVSLLVPKLASSYPVAPSAVGRHRRNDVTEMVIGDGAVVTSVADLAGWHAFMASGAVLGLDVRDELLTEQRYADGSPLGYAFGLACTQIGGEAAWWHSGSWAGYRAGVIYLPERAAGISVLANSNDRYAPYVAAAVANALVTGEPLRSCYAAIAGIPELDDRAAAAAEQAAGLWHSPALDLFLPPLAARDGRVITHYQDDELDFGLGADGRWHGIGIAAGTTFTVAGDTLTEGWGLSAGIRDRYVRAEAAASETSASETSSTLGQSSIFHNRDMRVHALLQLGAAGAAEIVIGPAAPRHLVPAGSGVWRADRGDALTVRLADNGSVLLVSVPGVHHLRFEAVADVTVDELAMRLPRGLRAGK